MRRSWSRGERATALSGFVGGLCIAIEPVLCGIILAVLAVGTFSLSFEQPSGHRSLALLVPVFALGLVVCSAYVGVVMAGPTRELLRTLRPILIVDGYVCWRPPDEGSPFGSNGYAAVLSEAGELVCEWPTLGLVPLSAGRAPALVEFSERDGIHRVDGRPSGLLGTGTVPAGVRLLR